MFRQIKDITITKTIAEDSDFLIAQNPTTGETYKITVENLLGATVTPTNKLLTFAFSGDANGLCNYLGTNKNTAAWQNPHNNGLVISASTIENGSVTSLVDRQASQFYTASANGSWVKLSISTGKLKCNYYSLRNRSNTLHYLRNWKLQGSNDDTVWTDIDTKTNDTTLNTASQWLSIPVTSSIYYSFFRLLGTGLDSSGAYYMCLGEIELYGEYQA